MNNTVIILLVGTIVASVLSISISLVIEFVQLRSYIKSCHEELLKAIQDMNNVEDKTITK